MYFQSPTNKLHIAKTSRKYEQTKYQTSIVEENNGHRRAVGPGDYVIAKNNTYSKESIEVHARARFLTLLISHQHSDKI
jgi:hypothetical protein